MRMSVPPQQVEEQISLVMYGTLAADVSSHHSDSPIFTFGALLEPTKASRRMLAQISNVSSQTWVLLRSSCYIPV